MFDLSEQYVIASPKGEAIPQGDIISLWDCHAVLTRRSQ